MTKMSLQGENTRIRLIGYSVFGVNIRVLIMFSKWTEGQKFLMNRMVKGVNKQSVADSVKYD